MKIVFFGTSSFAARILQSLFDTNQDICAVVTRTDKPRGRSRKPSYPPVKETALTHPNIPIFQPEKASTDSFANELKSFNADLFIVVAYGEILKENILAIPKLGCINIHASLLPSYRGAAPIQRALMAGEKTTGITIIDMVLKMDAGDMIAREKIPIPPDMNFEKLDDALCNLAIQLIDKVIAGYKNNTISKTPQDHTKATFAPKILPEETEIDWTQPATQIYNKIRALSPKPGAWCYVKIGDQKKRLKILKAQIQEKEGAFLIPTADKFIEPLIVQLEGKKAMKVEDFLRGFNPVL